MLTTAQPGLVAAAADQRDRYEEMARQLRALAMTLNAMVENYEASPQSLDGAISAGGEAGHVETVIMHVYELMKHRVLGEESPLRANPEVWASFQEQQPEFIIFFGSARIALEMYGEILRMYQQVSGQAAYGARPGELDGVRQDKHVQVEERRHCITAIREFSGKFTATFDTTELRAMHYMMLSHDLSKSPGRYRNGAIYVHDERTDRVVYEGPDYTDVPTLMEALAASLHVGLNSDPIVRSAMAHLNLVMIHPFRDGNGRMARALATLVLTRSDIGEPEFCSIEEWLGANTEDYYSVLAHTGHGSWQPRSDPHLWLTFNLRAHHMQAQTVARRVDEARQTWSELDVLAQEHGLPERTLDAMFDAVLGYRVRRGGYMKRTGVTEQTATRDLTSLSSAGILSPHGTGRGRHYIAGDPLRTIQDRRRATRKPLHDPYPWMRAKLAEPV